MSQPHLSEDLKKELKEDKKEARKYLLVWPVTGFLALGMIAVFWKIYSPEVAKDKVLPTQQISYPQETPAVSDPAINEPSANAPSVSPTPIPAATPTPTSGGQTHIVKDGDSLWNIAAKYNTTVEAIQKANNMSGENLQIGQKLIIP